MSEVIHNINAKWYATLTIINTDADLIASRTNNDTNDEIDADALDASSITIKDMNTSPIAGKTNNNTDNKVNMDALSSAIKDMDMEPTSGGTNNDMDVEFDTSVFISGNIKKTDVKLDMSGLGDVNKIVKKDIYESNLF